MTFVEQDMEPTYPILLGTAVQHALEARTAGRTRIRLEVVVDERASEELARLQADVGRWGRPRHPDRVDEILVGRDQDR